jgi:predicted porin
MKKSLLALAVLSAFAGAASAQSSVTLSGGLDVAIQRQNGDWNMSTGNSGRTNFTLSGREDLGGGMYAFFAMNYRFNAATGQTTSQPETGRFFRQSWLGLGGAFGDVRLGRMLPALQELNGGYDPFGTETIGSVHANGAFNVAGLAGSARVNNAIYYRSPNIGGLQIHANVAAADANASAAGANGTEKPIGLAAQYAAGPVRVALAYDRDALDLKTLGIYGGFNFGFADVMFQYEKPDVSPSDDTSIWSIGARIPMGAAVAKVGYRNWSDAEQKKFAVGLDYSLSKRTIVYTDVAKQSGDGFNSDQKKAQFDVGVWHKF